MAVNTCPAVLVAAPASGQGKTTVAVALARLHARAGRRVRLFKCGPDFLDPFWHVLASGVPAHPLDLWMNGEADCAARLHAAAGESDLVVVEGAMGLYDGTPSAADLARRFGLPVLAVVDAGAMAATFGAIAHGLRTWKPGLRWAGVLANRVANERHAAMLHEGLDADAGWLGALPRGDGFTLPSRHLGLMAASELDDATARLDAAADALAATPLGQADPSRWMTEFSAPAAAEPVPPLLAGRTVAVARDAAFCFVYQANLDTLAALGARLVFFSPLAGDGLPPCDAVWLPGGYPELHAERLSRHASLREALHAHAARGAPVWAECGGMMVLFDTLATADGQPHALWGLLPGQVTMQRRLAALGPQQWQASAGTLRGHTFHYSTCATPLVPAAHTARQDGAEGEAVYRAGSVQASYFHAWFASSPRATAALFGGRV